MFELSDQTNNQLHKDKGIYWDSLRLDLGLRMRHTWKHTWHILEVHARYMQREPVPLGSQLKMNNSCSRLQAADHNHPVDAVDCQVQAIQSQMRKRAHEEITPVTAMYNEQQKLPSFISLKCSLYHNRHSRLSPLPKMKSRFVIYWNLIPLI